MSGSEPVVGGMNMSSVERLALPGLSIVLHIRRETVV